MIEISEFYAVRISKETSYKYIQNIQLIIQFAYFKTLGAKLTCPCPSTSFKFSLNLFIRYFSKSKRSTVGEKQIESMIICKFALTVVCFQF